MSTPKWAIIAIEDAESSGSKKLYLDGAGRAEALSEIPDRVFNLSELRYLVLSNNSITRIPDPIKKLKNLVSLDLWNNNLSEFPIAVTKLPNLTKLDISQNQIPVLPVNITVLKKLREIDVRSNQLTELPEIITTLKNLDTLRSSGNPLITPPPEVADRGISSIIKYFRQLREGKDHLYEAKLLILGEGGAGKTTLAKKLENPDYQLKEEESTQGVDVIQWTFPIDSQRTFRVNIWDFGGQEIYHTTHQFFLTKRSLYALVADTRKEDTDFYYWLNVVELLSDNSPLLIIKNEKQDRHREINERQLRGGFDNLQGIFEVNLATNRGLNDISEKIKYFIQHLPHIGSPLPQTWVRVRERLENDNRNHVSQEEYLAICGENGFANVRDSLQLSGYLHDIGVFLHFQDDPLLRKTVILKPKWGTEAVYKVLDNKKVIRNLGHFTREDIEVIWKSVEYENMRDELLRLMMRFKLCYEIPNQKGTYTAPQLLTENQPEYGWDERKNLVLRYSYEFMPKGILTQFIVVMHQFIWSQKTVWKSGVVLERNKARAEVVELYGKREIRVRTSGINIHKKGIDDNCDTRTR